jgi:threonine aldolase
MSEVTRRAFVGMAAVAGGAAALGPSRPKKAPAGGGAARAVDFTVDGVPFTTAEWADLLARLSAPGRIAGDEYSRGGAVESLEVEFAQLLGKEAAVFMPSGTLANQLAVRKLAGARRRVIVQESSHLYNDTGDCADQLSQLTLLPLAPGKATFSWEDVERALDRTASGRVAAEVGVISIESPVRRLHGETFDFGQMQRVSAEARKRGIGLHLDGARLFVAAAYSGRSPGEYCALFDTVYVSLWKCFSSGGGAVLAGPKALLADMFQLRRMFGGALWNAWPYAAVASHQAEGYLERLTAAVRVSEALIALLSADARFGVERVPGGTSLFRLTPKTPDLAAFRQRLAARGIAVGPADGAGFWLKVNETLQGASAQALAGAFRACLSSV